MFFYNFSKVFQILFLTRVVLSYNSRQLIVQYFMFDKSGLWRCKICNCYLGSHNSYNYILLYWYSALHSIHWRHPTPPPSPLLPLRLAAMIETVGGVSEVWRLKASLCMIFVRVDALAVYERAGSDKQLYWYNCEHLTLSLGWGLPPWINFVGLGISKYQEGRLSYILFAGKVL